MIASQRAVVILNLLREHGAVSISDITAACACSEMSARRDLNRLAAEGLVRRTHGGAVLAAATSPAASLPEAADASPPAAERPTYTDFEQHAALVDRSDVVIVTPVQTEALDLLVQRAQRAGVSIVAESIPYRGATTVIAVDDYRAGIELGRWAGRHLLRQRPGPFQVLDVTSLLPNAILRSRGFADGLQQVAPGCQVLRVIGHDVREAARAAVADTLALNGEIDLIFGINDDSALGALDACRAAGLPDERLTVVSFGLEGAPTRDLLAARGPYQAGVAMFPELVGRACIDAAVCAYNRCTLPERVLMPFEILTADTLPDYYQRDERADTWNVRPEALERLILGNEHLAHLSSPHAAQLPEHIGYVQVFSSHEWYHNVQAAMRARCKALAINLEVIDASHDLADEADRLDCAIGRAAASLVVDGDTIILDTGPATLHLATALHGRRGITVITNSLDVLAELSDETGIRLISSGGVLRAADRALVGRGAEDTFSGLRASKVFLTGLGLSNEFGLSTESPSEAGVKQAMLRAARETIALCDHTRIGRELLVRLAPLESLRRLVTDAGLSVHDQSTFTRRNIEIMIAS